MNDTPKETDNWLRLRRAAEKLDELSVEGIPWEETASRVRALDSQVKVLFQTLHRGDTSQTIFRVVLAGSEWTDQNAQEGLAPDGPAYAEKAAAQKAVVVYLQDIAIRENWAVHVPEEARKWIRPLTFP